jgi:DNA-binding HxlR family transcriptional regulator
MRHEANEAVPCSISRSLAVLGERWTFLVIKQAFGGVRRFEDFRASLDISRSRLADRLDRLVEQGILVRVPYFNGRTRMEYRLTDKGRDIYPVLIALRDWGDQYMAPDGPPVRYGHRDCRGEAHVTVACDHCGQALTARDVEPAAGPGALEAA